MIKITLLLSLVLILFTSGPVIDGIIPSQSVLANNVDSYADDYDVDDANKKDQELSEHIYTQSYDSISSNSYEDSFVSSLPSTHKMTDILSINFAGIIDTQISAGLDN